MKANVAELRELEKPVELAQSRCPRHVSSSEDAVSFYLFFQINFALRTVLDLQKNKSIRDVSTFIEPVLLVIIN